MSALMDARAEQRRKDRESLLDFLREPRTVRQMCQHLARSKVAIYRHLRELRGELTVRENVNSRHQKNQAWVTYETKTPKGGFSYRINNQNVV